MDSGKRKKDTPEEKKGKTDASRLHYLGLFASPAANLVILLLPLVYVPTMNKLSKKDCIWLSLLLINCIPYL